MTTRVSFDPDARVEMLEAVAWYTEKEAALGLRFVDELDRALADIIERPHAYPLRLDVPKAMGVRHRLLVRFPYALVFLPLASEIRVLAIAHQKRRPGYFGYRVPRAHGR